MPAPDRDAAIVRHILQYCSEVEIAHADFGTSKERFLASSTYRNAISMPILQIGELANHLSADFREKHKSIPWRQIIATRNFYAHEYHAIDIDLVWATSLEDIQALKGFCSQYLKQ